MKLTVSFILLFISFAGFTTASAYYDDDFESDEYNLGMVDQGQPTIFVGTAKRRVNVVQALAQLKVARKIAVVNRLPYPAWILCYSGGSRIGPYTLQTGDTLAFGFTKVGLTSIGAKCDVRPRNRRIDNTDFTAWNSNAKPSVYNLRAEGILTTDNPNNDKGTLQRRWDYDD